MKKTLEDIIILQIFTINDSHMMCGSWDMTCNKQNFFVILDRFLPLINLTFEKMKKPPGDIIILQGSNINDNHIMCGSWDTKCDRQIFLSFWTIFALLIPQQPKKLKFWKNKKKPGDITILLMCTLNENHMMYVSWDMECDTQFFAILGYFSHLYPLTTQKLKILKKWKNHLEILSL